MILLTFWHVSKFNLAAFCVCVATGKEETFNILGISKVTERRHPYQILLPEGKLSLRPNLLAISHCDSRNVLRLSPLVLKHPVVVVLAILLLVFLLIIDALLWMRIGPSKIKMKLKRSTEQK